jgi:hypothetical protein
MKKTLFFLILAIAFVSCEKEPGTGGSGTISGNISKEFRVVLTNPATTLYTVPAADVEVYIVYGEHLSPDDKVMSDYEGNFEFRNLRKGKSSMRLPYEEPAGIRITLDVTVDGDAGESSSVRVMYQLKMFES